MHERLVHLVGNLSAEERACERISVQVCNPTDDDDVILSHNDTSGYCDCGVGCYGQTDKPSTPRVDLVILLR